MTAVNDALLRISMEQGKDIIVSDTNLRVRYIKRLLKNVDDTYDVELKDFIVDVDTCVKRDAMRPDSERVGEETIREMNKKNSPRKRGKLLTRSVQPSERIIQFIFRTRIILRMSRRFLLILMARWHIMKGAATFSTIAP